MPQSRVSFAPTDLYRALIRLITPMGVQASAGELYRGAIFGRDSLRVGLDLVPWFPDLAETILASLAPYQATTRNPVSDATGPGQIPHEIRSRWLGHREISGRPAEILVDLARHWGGTPDLLVYHGSVDATPQFVRLAHALVLQTGPEVLDQRLRHHEGHTATLRESVLAAVRWVSTEIKQNDLPLLGFQRLNTKHGHRWQILQDGATSVLHADGHLANTNNPVETIGLQGLAYDALTLGAALFEIDLPEEAATWRNLAAQVQQATLAQFWYPSESTFHTGLDRDPANPAQRRAIAALTALPVELLETGIFDTLPETDRTHYIGGIVKMAHGPDFLTSGGIRSRALRHAPLLNYPDYHGVFTCWGVTNSVYAHGLNRQGLPDLAADITNRHLGLLASTGALHEFMYVDDRGNVRWPITRRPATEADPNPIFGTNMPEIDQAWTLSFALRTLLEPEFPSPVPGSWQESLIADIAARQQLQRTLPSPQEAAAHQVPGVLDRDEARHREAAYLAAEALRS